jgi:hypothetical protein
LTRRELQRYLGGGENFCLLVDITLLDAEQQGEEQGQGGQGAARAEVFAPYQCRYRLFTRAAASQCFRARGVERVLFHGDSMMRAIYGNITMYCLGLVECDGGVSVPSCLTHMCMVIVEGLVD